MENGLLWLVGLILVGATLGLTAHARMIYLEKRLRKRREEFDRASLATKQLIHELRREFGPDWIVHAGSTLLQVIRKNPSKRLFYGIPIHWYDRNQCCITLEFSRKLEDLPPHCSILRQYRWNRKIQATR